MPQPKISTQPVYFAHITACTFANGAGYIHLCRWFGKREIRRPETYLRTFAVKVPAQSGKVFVSGRQMIRFHQYTNPPTW